MDNAQRESMETVARVLANGYNQRVRQHGPEGSYAGEAVPVGEHLGFIVTRAGQQFAVHVKPLQTGG